MNNKTFILAPLFLLIGCTSTLPVRSVENDKKYIPAGYEISIVKFVMKPRSALLMQRSATVNYEIEFTGKVDYYEMDLYYSGTWQMRTYNSRLVGKGVKVLSTGMTSIEKSQRGGPFNISNRLDLGMEGDYQIEITLYNSYNEVKQTRMFNVYNPWK